jgi:hypothetical protein
MRFVNLTSDQSYGVRRGIAALISDSEYNLRKAKIPSGIKDWWNAKPYRIKIRDRECGESIYTVFFNPVEVSSGEHYRIDLYNVPIDFGSGAATPTYFIGGDKSRPLPPQAPIPHPARSSQALGRSFVVQDPNGFWGSWNLASPKTCTDTHMSGHTGWHNMLEPHEFAHMLGLVDGYYDFKRQINGLKFQVPEDAGTNFGTVLMTAPGRPGTPVCWAPCKTFPTIIRPMP